MLNKLDSGDYVNTDYIERLWMINEHDGFIRFVNAPDVPISEKDRGLILKAMNPKIMLTGESGKLEPTIYHEGGIDYAAMAFSPLINGHEVTDDEQ
ncbi:hypothetical protein GKD24_00390 [Lactobacillus paracasei]|uniref:hypothetical protein n=1 Tax=Lacticaseibacillus paracasei TaxID=1597 RepID=UPI000D356B3F|nr:hypothetical protein [Lacticaseibacillus paracasei]KAB7125068.1 hypothetical protein GBD12_11645 [Bifidobacterium longum]PTS56312.1 hypothetical protein DBQ61_09315 [Lactobacillus sp. DS22_6]MBX4165181.1 hypothetical protein [Lacticaseibacillus paracasei]MCZ2751468.1 hypothetical protein [Lacticaseibacillus paracasei]MCZ2761911.1 hypothetical protein [Lacticaseibacillus paracasei]